jgi:hypothetical protein
MCPHCKRDAPVVLRGLRASCTNCGFARSPLDSARAVNVAGQPARIGGTVAHVAGWIVLLAGLLVALVVGGIAQLLFPASSAGLFLGVPIALLASAFASVLLLGGRKMRKSGEDSSKTAHEEAIYALAEHRSGSLEAREVARALAISQETADALLTNLAKRPESRVTMEVDDDGIIRFLFTDFARRRFAVDRPGPRVVVEPAPSVRRDAIPDAEVEPVDEPARRSQRSLR